MKGEIRYAVGFVQGKYVREGYTPQHLYNWEQSYDGRVKPLVIAELSQEQKARYLENSQWRVIFRRVFGVSRRVLVVGKTFIRLGYLYAYDDFHQFQTVDQIAVWKVMPFIENDDRYYKPFLCLEGDLFETMEGAIYSLFDEKYPKQNKEGA